MVTEPSSAPASRASPGAARWRTGVALLLAGFALAVLGAALLLSALNAANAQRFLDDWGRTGQTPDPRAFAAAEAAAIRAVRFYPGPAGEHWDRLGRVYSWAHWRAPVADDDSAVPRLAAARLLENPLGEQAATDVDATRGRALVAFENAVRHRPLWPYGQIRLADAQRRAGVDGEALSLRLQRAFDLGPWRPAVNRRIAAMGLRGWDALTPAARDVVLTNARRAVRYSDADREHVIDVARQTGHSVLIDALVLP
ncbi:hypothetical protein [Spiribacter roseus]|uniref:Uncharacterized protein n=1 Tax=Spiribacter roseus TaxID=1855875 RepID=A0ABV3RZW7_9GAMM